MACFASLCLIGFPQDLAYAQVAQYLKPKDSLDYLTHQMNVMESGTKALQVFLGKKHAVCINCEQ